MSTEIASFYATIGADVSGLNKGLEQAKSGLTSLTTGFGQLTDATSVALKAAGVAMAAFGGAIIATGIQFDAMKEQANVAFTTMLGSGQAAQSMLNELQDFAAKTPFEFPDLIRASQRLMAMGIQANEVIPTLTAVGDAVAAMGGSAEMVDRVTTAIGQMNAKGKASGEEMRQLTEAGIPVWQMLADKIGVTIPEAMKKVTDGAVSSTVAIEAITTGIETRFGGMMEAQSHTFNGIISNIKDGFGQLSGQIMKPFFDMAKVGLEKVATIMSQLNTQVQHGLTFWGTLNTILFNLLPKEMMDRWAIFEQHIQDAISVIQAIITPITKAIGEFIKWQDVAVAVGIVVVAAIASIVAGFAPMIATFVAITAAVAAFRWAWEQDFMGIRAFTLHTLQKISDWFYKESGLWKGTWEDTFSSIADTIEFWAKFQLYNTIMLQVMKVETGIRIWKQKIQILYDEWAGYVYGVIMGWVNDTLGLFNRWANDMLSAYHEWADPLLRDITHWAEGVKFKFDWMVQWIIGDLGYWAQLVNYLKDKWKSFTDWWDDHIQPWVDSGREMVQGLWDGIKDKWSAMTDWFRGKWEDLKRNFRSFFGISSPSKLFMDYGKNISLGLAKGIGNEQGMVDAAMNGLTMGVTQAATYNAAPSPASNPNTALLQRNNQLLEILIQELRGKNMTANVTVGGGGGNSLGALVGATARLG